MVETFTRLTVATYASRFDEYSGEEFRAVEIRPLKKQRVMVRSELEESDHDVVQLDYVLHETGEGWRIINVIADGVSDLSIKRADYTSILKNAGFDALISRLNEQIDSFAASS
jgi:phospholipid transport system substrate-binding protein